MIADHLSMDSVTVGITIESVTQTPEQITQRLGIAWDEARWIGDPRGHTAAKWERNSWTIFVRKHGSVDIGAHSLLPICVAALVQRLAPISQDLREISAAEGAEFFIHVSAQSVPGVNLSPETIRLLADAGLSLDVDIILYSLEED